MPDEHSTKPDRDLAFVATHRPVDATAARVVSAGPKGYESGKKILQVCSATPLPLRPLPKNIPNLIGRTFGYLSVIGLWAENRSNTAKWVCRCVCGYYVTRGTKAIRNPNNIDDRCDRCREVRFLRRNSEWRQLGYNPDEIGRQARGGDTK